MNVEFDHALVIGGTGMLADATVELAHRSGHVTLVARRAQRLRRRLRDSAVTEICCDYRKTTALRAMLNESTDAHGPFDLAVIWMHISGNASLKAVLQMLDELPGQCRVIHLLGSSHAEPDADDFWLRGVLNGLESVEYQQIILGFVRNKSQSRWLTDEEICAGTIEALDSGHTSTIVGVVRPWSARP